MGEGAGGRHGRRAAHNTCLQELQLRLVRRASPPRTEKRLAFALPRRGKRCACPVTRVILPGRTSRGRGHCDRGLLRRAGRVHVSLGFGRAARARRCAPAVGAAKRARSPPHAEAAVAAAAAPAGHMRRQHQARPPWQPPPASCEEKRTSCSTVPKGCARKRCALQESRRGTVDAASRAAREGLTLPPTCRPRTGPPRVPSARRNIAPTVVRVVPRTNAHRGARPPSLCIKQNTERRGGDTQGCLQNGWQRRRPLAVFPRRYVTRRA